MPDLFTDSKRTEVAVNKMAKEITLQTQLSLFKEIFDCESTERDMILKWRGQKKETLGNSRDRSHFLEGL